LHDDLGLKKATKLKAKLYAELSSKTVLFLAVAQVVKRCSLTSYNCLHVIWRMSHDYSAVCSPKGCVPFPICPPACRDFVRSIIDLEDHEGAFGTRLVCAVC
jgi:hypothetical protein